VTQDAIDKGMSGEAFESNRHSFVLRVWLEEADADSGKHLWRGQVIHVPTGTRHPLYDLADLPACIAPYLTTASGWVGSSNP